HLGIRSRRGLFRGGSLAGRSFFGGWTGVMAAIIARKRCLAGATQGRLSRRLSDSIGSRCAITVSLVVWVGTMDFGSGADAGIHLYGVVFRSKEWPADPAAEHPDRVAGKNVLGTAKNLGGSRSIRDLANVFLVSERNGARGPACLSSALRRRWGRGLGIGESYRSP